MGPLESPEDLNPKSENKTKLRKSEIPKTMRKLRLAHTKVTVKKWIKMPMKFGRKVKG